MSRESLRQSAEARVFNIDKEISLTSYDVVETVKRLTGVMRVGHAGSLDPFATGVLLVCTGRATKITRFLMELEKEYTGTVRLGVETDTDDLTGEAVSERKCFDVSLPELRKAVSSFEGTFLQHPPRVSALKQNGRRLYEMARRGESFETEAREVTVSRFELLDFRHLDVDFSLTCSRGTYVRSIARDLGRLLGCGGHLRSLRRTRVGHFVSRDAVTVGALKSWLEDALSVGPDGPAAFVPGSVSMADALSFLPGFFLKKGMRESVLHGRSPVLSDFEAFDDSPAGGGMVRILSSDGELLAVGKKPEDPEAASVKLERVLAATTG